MLKKICSFFIFSIFVCVIISGAQSVAGARELDEKILRLHILANSDSNEDQELKLKVRDAVLEYTAGNMPQNYTKTQAMQWASDHFDEIKNVAEGVIADENKDYGVTVAIERVYFETREYENSVRLPAGNYTALRILIGEGKGKNWWCVMFPSVCFSSSVEAGEQLDQVLSTDTADLAKYPSTEDVEVKFKIAEIIGEIFG